MDFSIRFTETSSWDPTDLLEAFREVDIEALEENKWEASINIETGSASILFDDSKKALFIPIRDNYLSGCMLKSALSEIIYQMRSPNDTHTIINSSITFEEFSANIGDANIPKNVIWSEVATSFSCVPVSELPNRCVTVLDYIFKTSLEKSSLKKMLTRFGSYSIIPVSNTSSMFKFDNPEFVFCFQWVAGSLGVTIMQCVQ